MKKYFSAIAILLIVSPSIALASWWNPFSWNIFHRVNKTQVLENRIQELEKKLDNKAISTTSASFEEVIKEQKAKAAQINTQLNKSATPKTYEQTIAEQQVKAEQIRNQLNKPVEATKTNTEVNNGTYCNGKYWSQCPTGQTFTCPQSGNAYCDVPNSPLNDIKVQQFIYKLGDLYKNFNSNGTGAFNEYIKAEISKDYNRALNQAGIAGDTCKSTQEKGRSIEIEFIGLPYNYENAARDMQQAGVYLCHALVNQALEDHDAVKQNLQEVDAHINKVYNFFSSLK